MFAGGRWRGVTWASRQCLGGEKKPSRAESVSGLLVNGVKEPLGELPELGRCRLTLLLQAHVVLPQVLDLLLQHRLVLLLLHAQTQDVRRRTRTKRRPEDAVGDHMTVGLSSTRAF